MESILETYLVYLNEEQPFEKLSDPINWDLDYPQGKGKIVGKMVVNLYNDSKREHLKKILYAENKKKQIRAEIRALRTKLSRIKRGTPEYRRYSKKIIKLASDLKYLSRFKFGGKIGTISTAAGKLGKMVSLQQKITK